MEDLPEEERQIIEDAYAIMDREQDGSVTSKELAIIMRALGRQPTDNQLQAMINEVDSDGNGSIEMAEFCSMILRKMHDTNHEDELRDAFRVFDKENNGYITSAELKVVLTALGLKLPDDEIEEMIREYDIDQDGHLDFEEFVNMMTTR
ncbi:neo-calmodulin [Drosophila guanche]|uniref:Blast:Calmodulin n=1 Tax=Drosophila guanche TaxID=7266 RepID=A0A3B0J2T9_DROGU|nr:neo-calmodulin [Drosophila guanche]SPP75545.1 blast:Calmodulin [Drosophila guanche]